MAHLDFSKDDRWSDPPPSMRNDSTTSTNRSIPSDDDPSVSTPDHKDTMSVPSTPASTPPTTPSTSTPRRRPSSIDHTLAKAEETSLQLSSCKTRQARAILLRKFRDSKPTFVWLAYLGRHPDDLVASSNAERRTASQERIQRHYCAEHVFVPVSLEDPGKGFERDRYGRLVTVKRRQRQLFGRWEWPARREVCGDGAKFVDVGPMGETVTLTPEVPAGCATWAGVEELAKNVETGGEEEEKRSWRKRIGDVAETLGPRARRSCGIQGGGERV